MFSAAAGGRGGGGGGGGVVVVGITCSSLSKLVKSVESGIMTYCLRPSLPTRLPCIKKGGAFCPIYVCCNLLAT